MDAGRGFGVGAYGRHRTCPVLVLNIWSRKPQVLATATLSAEFLIHSLMYLGFFILIPATGAPACVSSIVRELSRLWFQL